MHGQAPNPHTEEIADNPICGVALRRDAGLKLVPEIVICVDCMATHAFIIVSSC